MNSLNISPRPTEDRGTLATRGVPDGRLAGGGLVGQPHDPEGRQGERGGIIQVVPAGGLGADGSGQGIAAAEFAVVGVQDLPPASGPGKPDTVVMAGYRGEIGQAGHRAPG